MPARFTVAVFFLFFFFSAVCNLMVGEEKPTTSSSAEKTSVPFSDATTEVGLYEELRGAYLHAIAWGDFDNDGLLDLFVGNFADRSPKYGRKTAPPNLLFRQFPRGKFQRFSCPPVEIGMRCSGAVFVDLDNDGDLDLYVTSNTLAKPTKTGIKEPPQREFSRLYRNDGKGNFVDVTQGSGVAPRTLLRARDIGVFDYNADGLPDLFVMQDKGISDDDKLTKPHLFENLGNLKFRNVGTEVGLPNDLWGAGIAVADLNHDRRSDFYICGVNRLFLSQRDHTFKEASELRPVFNAPEKELDWTTGGSFGDIDGDGDLDLITGRHHYYGTSRIHVYRNQEVKKGVPQFQEITSQLNLKPLPQKAPHPEIQDFDNDGKLDLYWSAWFSNGEKRWPFICRGQGMQHNLPRYQIPATDHLPLRFHNDKIAYLAPETGPGMMYYVNSPAVDFDGDGDLDMLGGMWPDEPSRFFRNETRGGHWLEVVVKARTCNRNGIGGRITLYLPGHALDPSARIGMQEITLNGGYSSSRPAMTHFGLGKLTECDVVVELPAPAALKPIVLRNQKVNQLLQVNEP